MRRLDNIVSVIGLVLRKHRRLERKLMKYAAHSIYIISESTKALLTVDSPYYRTKVIAEEDEFLSIYEPEKIIENSCIVNGLSFHGGRRAIKERYGMNNKIPVPIDIKKSIYFFPTSSPKRKKCVWLSYYQINAYEKRGNQCYIQFLDGTGIYVNASYNTIDMQHKRTSQIIAQTNRPIYFSKNYRNNRSLLKKIRKKINK